MTDQPQNEPTARTGAGSEPTGDMPAALGPEAPADVQPVDETELPAVPEAPAVPPPPPTPAVPPPPPPLAIATAMHSQGTGVPAAVAPPEPGESASILPPTVAQAGSGPAWRPEDEPSRAKALAAERPEVAVGTAFAGGLVLALILKRLAR